MDLFRVRLNCIDHYQATPTHYDPQLRNDVGPAQAKKGPKVPVVRIFGSTETGQKVCAHIHGAFPYVYVEYRGSLEPEDVGAYIYRLHLSIDHALAFVARITLVKGVPFYGFHIYILSDLLQQGVILKQKFQPYEAHLQYLLQFMTDYNLYGDPIPSFEKEGNSQHLWHDRTIPKTRVLDGLTLPRVNICERRLHHDFVERLKPLPEDFKLDETRRRNPFPAEVLRDSQPQGWIHEEEYKEEVAKLIESEKGLEESAPPSFETFAAVKTALQSVEDLYPSNLLPALGLPSNHVPTNKNPASSVLNLGVDDYDPYPADSDEEALIQMGEPMTRQDGQIKGPGIKGRPSVTSDTGSRSEPAAVDPTIKIINGLGMQYEGTGNPPVVPVWDDLLDMAEQEGSDLYLHMRQCLLTNAQEPSFQYLPCPIRSIRSRCCPQILKTSHDHLRMQAPSPRPTTCWVFQWSKSQEDPGTKLRLSQMSQPRASQQAEKDSQKHVSFSLAPEETRSSPYRLLQQRRFESLLQKPTQQGPKQERKQCSIGFRQRSDPSPQSVSMPTTAKKRTSRLVPESMPAENSGSRATLCPIWRNLTQLGHLPPAWALNQTHPLIRPRTTLCSYRSWEIAQPPPSVKEVQDWWNKKHPITGTPQATRRNLSQIDGPTPKNKHGFKYSPKKKSTSVKHEAQYMSTMALEVHVNTRGKFVPNPDEDEVQCIFWSIKADGTASSSQEASGRMRRYVSAEVIEESSELDVMVRMVQIVRDHDPDILTGYEVHGSSWGYLIERARFSRMKKNSHGRIGKENDRWGFNTTSTIRGKLNLLQYTMENVVWHVLHRRIPHYSWRTLTQWYNSSRRDLDKLTRYYLTRTRIDIQILESNELIPRTSEQARLLGVDFFSVFSRGSQFKVESIMFRIAKPENFMLISPSRKQVGGQNALECLPLVMEPQSDFYNSPLLVLDFQSLYPSVMIAYNLCYSTFLGRIVNWRGMNKMGFTEYQRHKRLLELLKDHINITPNGMMYVRPEIRKSLLAKMLGEILETRVMVKSGMKQDKDDKTLQALLNNRQLALKLLANVTYGYTSASFSGRMPCSEIADSIVQTGRETLERAIAFIHSQEQWGAEVVYGDTDSLFVYLKGRTKDQAFDIGNEIAKAITDMNPRPIKLKFEKVYHPCVLLAKKRYVGYKYESKDQVTPEFDAKGIETVRRDGTPAEQKIEEKALKLLEVKAYFQKQCEKIMRGSVSGGKLGTYSDKGPPPPGALISTKKILEDARAEPQYGERVPYVVITGAPGARLIDRCVAPEDLLNDSHSQLDAEYYISKNLIPPLERIFNLVGANVRQWYDEMPKVQRIRRVDQTLGAAGGLGSKKTLESYLKSASCISCNIKMQVEGVLCGKCQQDAPSSLFNLQTRLKDEERKYMDRPLPAADEVPCDSKDCPVFYSRSSRARGSRRRRAAGTCYSGLVAKAGRAALEW
ncbi:hypothetical protein BDP55DRAFT_688648 [Colletotrichum godetiae]|uniref:DNA polymerase n=1 Tax=Colletotrichum godetiae TaxID=1209918 RepID=A0AAJ0A4X9_9PEZI|nr:uncharacterized protein BDP55DRAFT_688648 [Colletotrichum godetiae]KAK1656562.1 hypothetical protein BDP55DRAFT_688648 [Colletotrichum godetiae]